MKDAYLAVSILLGIILAIPLSLIFNPFNKYHCTRYEIIGKSPDRHEVCAVYTRKEGV